MAFLNLLSIIFFLNKEAVSKSRELMRQNGEVTIYSALWLAGDIKIQIRITKIISSRFYNRRGKGL